MLSIIICSVDNTRFQNVSREYERVLRGTPFEIIRINDATGMSEGYNRGIQRAKYDHMIFSHDDIEFAEDDFHQKVMSRLGKFDLLGVAGASRVSGPRWIDAGPPYIFGQVTHATTEGAFTVDMYNNTHRVFAGMKVLDGVFIATHRRVAEQLSFDEKHFQNFHFYDLDFSLRAFKGGAHNRGLLRPGNHSPFGGSYNSNWMAEADVFMTRYAKEMTPSAAIKFMWSSALAPTLREAKILMNPDLWTPFSA